MSNRIEKIEIEEGLKRAWATFSNGVKLPMNYTSAEKMFTICYREAVKHNCIKEGKEVVTLFGNTIKVLKTYKGYVSI